MKRSITNRFDGETVVTPIADDVVALDLQRIMEIVGSPGPARDAVAAELDAAGFGDDTDSSFIMIDEALALARKNGQAARESQRTDTPVVVEAETEEYCEHCGDGPCSVCGRGMPEDAGDAAAIAEKAAKTKRIGELADFVDRLVKS